MEMRKLEWSDERRREERAGTQMVGIMLLALLCVGAALLIAWPAKVASLLLVLCGASTSCAALYERNVSWAGRAFYAATGAGMAYLGVRLVIYAYWGVW